MGKALFANNANTTLAGAITNTATTAALASGSGALFPTPSGGNYFCMTFNDAATGLLFEIVHVTAISGDTITMVRGQEGTTALSWLAGDKAGNWITAGTAATWAQQSDVQVQPNNYIADSSGAANTIVATLGLVPTSLSSIVGSPVRVKVANTSTSTTVNLNVNSLGNVQVVLPGGSAPSIGAFVAGSIYEFLYNGTYFQATTLPTLGTAAYKTATNNSDTYVASVGATVSIGHFATFNDTAGTLVDGGAPGTAAFVNTGSSGGTLPLLNAHANWSGSQSSAPVAINDSSPAINLNASNVYYWTLGGNRTCPLPINIVAGTSGCIWLIQDGTGSHTLAYNSVWEFSGGVPPTLSTAAGSKDLLCWEVDPTGTYIAANLLKAFA